MAMIDYGAIAFKNGKLMNTEMFGDMKEMVGWEDTDEDVKSDGSPLGLNGNYFAYIGDREITVAFYKCIMCIAEKHLDVERNYYFVEHEHFNCSNYIWSRWEQFLGGYRNGSNMKVTKRNGYYVCKWKYKGDRYKVYFGYGVDVDYYQKWHVVNAYRTPAFLWRQNIREIKDKIDSRRWWRERKKVERQEKRALKKANRKGV